MLRALGLASMLMACGGDEAGRPDAARDGPVARPSSVLAVLAIRGLDPAFAAARRLLGPLVPGGSNGRALAAALAGLEPSSREALDPDGSVFVLAIDRDPPGLVVALPTRRSPGPIAIAAGEPGVGSRVGQFFVTGPDHATIEAVAPWITSTLAGRSFEHDLVLEVDGQSSSRVERALVGLVTDLSEELGAEARAARVAMGRDPEIGEPEAIAGWALEVGRRWAAALGDAAIRAHVDFSADSAAARIELEASAGSGLAADLARTAPGDLGLLRLMPADAPLAVGVRRSESERRDASGRTLALLGRIAGSRLSADQAATLRSLAATWDAATGTEGALALTLEGPRATLRLATEASDPEDAAAAIDGLADSMGTGYLAMAGERLGAWIGPPSRIATTRSRIFRGGPSALFGERWEIRTTPPASEASRSERTRIHSAGASGGSGGAGGPPGGTTGRLQVALGPSAEIDWAPRTSVLDLADLAALRRAAGTKLTALGVASPSRLLPLVARLGGDRFARFAETVAARAPADSVTWSVAVDGRRLRIDLGLRAF